MRAPDWNEQLFEEHRAYVATDATRAAFDALVTAAVRLSRYDCGPTSHGRMRTFSYTDRFASAASIDTTGLQQPTSAEDPNWHLPGRVSARTDRSIKPGHLPHVVLSTIAAGGATMVSIQAAMNATVSANELAEDRHKALGLLQWAARDRGISFTCIDGIVTATDYRLEPARPFEFIVAREHLRFYVRRPGRHRVAEAALTAAFPQVEEIDGELVIDLESRADALRLHDLLFADLQSSLGERRLGFGRPYVPAGIVPASTPREPFTVDPDVVDRGNQGHATTQDALAVFLRSIGIEPRRSDTTCEPDYDLGWTQEDRIWIAEVKSTTSENEEHQLRLGLGQVLRYRHALAAFGRAVTAVLVPERRPSDVRWIELCQALGVVLVWPGAFELLKSTTAEGEF